MSDENLGSPSAHDRGAALMKLKKFAEAAAALRQAVAQNPADEPSWRLLGGALASTGDAAGAVSAFENAARLAPQSAQNHYNLAIALQNAGNHYPVKGHLEQALALKPDYEQARAALREFARRGETMGYGMRETTDDAPASNPASTSSMASLSPDDDMKPLGGGSAAVPAAAAAAPPSSYAGGLGGASNVPPPPVLGQGYGPALNTSGQKGDVPADLQGGWNWGAFFLGWLWLINHNLVAWGIGLLVLSNIPYISILGLGASIYLGIAGNRIAWQNRRFQSVEDCRACQAIWAKWGIGVLIAGIVLAALVALVLFPVFDQARRGARGV